jgi:hypothetical protein
MKNFCIMLLLIGPTAHAAPQCQIISAKLCPRDDFSLGCAGKYGYQVVCEARSRVFLSRAEVETELQEFKKMYDQNFEVLYAYYSEDLDLFEIKRTDVSPESLKSDIYKWLVVSRIEGKLFPLTFIELQTHDEETIRTFNEGELRSHHS